VPRLGSNGPVRAVVRAARELCQYLVIVHDLGHLRVQAVAAIARVHGGKAADPAGMPDRDLQRHAGSEAISEKIGPRQAEMVKQDGYVVGQGLIPQRPASIGSMSMALELDGDDPPVRGEQRGIVAKQADRHQGAVDDDERLASAKRLVVHRQPAETGEPPGRGFSHDADASCR